MNIDGFVKVEISDFCYSGFDPEPIYFNWLWIPDQQAGSQLIKYLK